jgi:drug/metabolite transporter (DMT)-like permease
MIATASPPVTAHSFDPRLAASLAAVYLVWSSTYLALGIAVDGHMPPLVMACMRFTVAGAIMLATAHRRGAEWPSARDWLRSVLPGGFLFLGGNGFVSLAERSVSSGGVAVVCATMPLWAGVLAAATGERPTRREWLSLGLGFAGVLVLMNGPGLAGTPADIAFAIGSPICWAIGSLLARRTRDIGGAHAALVQPALQMLTGGVVLFAASAVHGEPLPVHATAGAWLALAYLIVFGSLVGFTAYAWLLRNARPVIATSYAYVNPGLAVLIGWALHGESLGWTTAAANGMIVAAILLGLSRRR